jgi:Nuclease-related domain
MPGRRHDDGRLCLCDPPDGTCAGLVVRRLSRDRVRELAEEIWTASSGDVLPARPAVLDPGSSRAGASAQAAYRRHRERERAGWRLGWVKWTAAVIGAAAVGSLVIGLSVGAWLGWPIGLLLAAWTGWRLRFRPSPGVRLWRRQAAMQRRAAAALLPLAEDGCLVLHDVALPGWLDGLDHLVVGPTGVWVVGSWQGRRLLPGGRPPAATTRGLRGQAEAVAETLAGWARVPVRALLCVHSPWPMTPQAADGVGVAAPGQLSGVVRSGPTTPAEDLEQAGTRLLEVLRPAA